MTNKEYINNLETRRIELHFEKSEYMALSDTLKAELKLYFLWSRTANAWVSKSTQNHYSSIRLAEKLGFTEEKREGQRLSYAEELEIKADKAEHRAERYDTYSDNAVSRAETLQGAFNSLRKDIAWLTQLNISSSKGRAFTNSRNRVMAKYEKGFEEYRKSEYFKEKAIVARNTAEKTQLKNHVYLYNRIEECKKNIRAYERALIRAEERKNQKWANDLIDKLEYEIDKQAFFENCMDMLNEELKTIGKKIYSREDIKQGYHIKTRFDNVWAEVLKVNPKTVSAKYITHPLVGHHCNPSYAEITEVKIPEDWKEDNSFENPYKVGDILARYTIYGFGILHAYQIVKVTSKTVTIRELVVEGNKPIPNVFLSSKLERRSVKINLSGDLVVNDSNWYLSKYVA